jgi:methionine-rich copper-binding protein CopC
VHRRVVPAAALVTALALASPALAHHADLVRSQPADGAQLAEAPRDVRAWFNLPLIEPGSGLAVTDQDERRVDAGNTRHDDVDPALLVAELPALAPGRYKVTWRVMAANDLDYNEGSFTFTVVADLWRTLLARARSGGALAVGLGLVGIGAITLARESQAEGERSAVASPG